ncbi:MAG: ABC transporter substrate-binding protein [Synergistaceae bacterium]|nr:ABC transporter substrate-binding protein [Synergistaceae bacterium]
MKSSSISKKISGRTDEKYKKRYKKWLISLLLFLSLMTSSPGRADAIEITDDLGRTVVLERPAARIVSLYAGHTENLAAIGAGGAIVAAGQDAEGLSPGIPLLGSKPGVEQIAALFPDIVLTRPMMARSQKSLYEALDSFGIKVLALDPPEWEKFPDYIALLARVAGVGGDVKKNAAEAMTTDAALGGKKLRAFLMTNGRTMATCAPDSWAAHIMELAGLENAASGAVPLTEGSVLSAFGAERLLAADGEIDVVLLQQGAMNTVRAEDFVRDARFASMRAVLDGMVFDVPEADISRPSLLRLKNGAALKLRAMVTGRASGCAEKTKPK